MPKLTDREIEIMWLIFKESSHVEKMVMTKEKDQTPYQKELEILFDKLLKINA